MPELCGVQTPTGPCTMDKGHKLPYHRHRIYNKVTWKVLNNGTVLEEGTGRVPLNYAMTRQLDKYDNIEVALIRHARPAEE